MHTIRVADLRRSYIRPTPAPASVSGTDSLHTRSCWPDRCDFAAGPAMHRSVVQRGCGGTLGPCWLVNHPFRDHE